MSGERFPLIGYASNKVWNAIVPPENYVGQKRFEPVDSEGIDCLAMRDLGDEAPKSVGVYAPNNDFVWPIRELASVKVAKPIKNPNLIPLCVGCGLGEISWKREIGESQRSWVFVLDVQNHISQLTIDTKPLGFFFFPPSAVARIGTPYISKGAKQMPGDIPFDSLSLLCASVAGCRQQLALSI